MPEVSAALRYLVPTIDLKIDDGQRRRGHWFELPGQIADKALHTGIVTH